MREIKVNDVVNVEKAAEQVNRAGEGFIRVMRERNEESLRCEVEALRQTVRRLEAESDRATTKVVNLRRALERERSLRIGALYVALLAISGLAFAVGYWM